MENYLDSLPRDLRGIIKLAGRVTREQNVHAYLVGGIVRDLILGVPNFDLDIAVQGDGLIFASRLAKYLRARLVTHPRFGTATLIASKNIKLDIATTRSEVYPEPASLPVVYPGTIRDDLARRDFTINALAIDLSAGNFGTVIDFYQGRQDLEAGLVRILHNLSFIDDPTRIIRAVRFEQRFRFKIEPQTLKLLKEAAAIGMLGRLSPHRLRDEIVLILQEAAAVSCILRLNKLIGLGFIHRRLKLDRKQSEQFKSIKNEINWFNRNFPGYRVLDVWLIYFTSILGRLNKNEINHVCERFGLRRGEIKRIESYLKLSARIASRLEKSNILPSKVYRELEPLSLEVILLIKARYRNKILSHHINRFLRYYNGKCLFICGKDLNKLGLQPGVLYKRLLTELLYLQLDGKINSRKEALAWVSRFCPKNKEK